MRTNAYITIPRSRTTELLVRGSLAAVWLYNGAWCKLAGGDARQAAVVRAVPGLQGPRGAVLLVALGIVETALALWVLSGRGRRTCATVQLALLVGMNAAGAIFSRHVIGDVSGMLVHNLPFAVLAWIWAWGMNSIGTGDGERNVR